MVFQSIDLNIFHPFFVRVAKALKHFKWVLDTGCPAKSCKECNLHVTQLFSIFVLKMCPIILCSTPCTYKIDKKWTIPWSVAPVINRCALGRCCLATLDNEFMNINTPDRAALFLTCLPRISRFCSGPFLIANPSTFKKVVFQQQNKTESWLRWTI